MVLISHTQTGKMIAAQTIVKTKSLKCLKSINLNKVQK